MCYVCVCVYIYIYIYIYIKLFFHMQHYLVVLITEESVYYAVRTEYLYIISINCSF